MKGWSSTTQMIWFFLDFSSRQSRICTPTIKPTMQINILRQLNRLCPKYLQPLLVHTCILLKKTSQPVSIKKQQPASTNLMNTSSFHLKILRHAIPFIGGWVNRLNFSNLFWFARDLLCIPGVYMVHIWCFFSTKLSSGSAVAVEHVFSGGHDTISLCYASLHPQTIKVLMLSKKKLHLLCAKVSHKWY